MQMPFSLLPSIPKMQTFRVLFSLKSIFTIHESQLLHSPPSLNFSIGKSSSSAYRPISSYYNKRSFHSSEKSPEGDEADAAARVWDLYEPISEQSMAKHEGEGEQFDRPWEGKSLQKGKLEMIARKVEDSGEDDEKPEILSRERYRWSSHAASKVNEKKNKMKSSWVCKECGANLGQWWGSCPSCKTAGSVKRYVEAKLVKPRGESNLDSDAVRLTVPQRLADVNRGMSQSDWRIPLNGHLGMEVARVLGGGLVPGSLVLLGGDPGVGKSTLLLQIATIISQRCNSRGPARVVYVSGEESIEQIGNRADRMRITSDDLYLYSSTDVEDILDKVQDLSPEALIVDSIQTVYLRDVIGSAGNITQVKECTLKLLHFAKETNIPVLLIGHVTKTGDIAGPRMLEHMVDAVLYMEGERYSSYRLLRSVKNRFGSTDELGLLEMTESGLQAVSNPSEMFLSENYSDSDVLAGLALAIIVDGSRTFVIEIQALCVSGTSVARHVNGIHESRADMIISVLMKQAGLKLQDNAIFLNVVSGFKLTETAGDLAIAAAICSRVVDETLNLDEKPVALEKKVNYEDGQQGEASKDKEETTNEAEEKEREDNEMTLEEYEKIREEKRKALLSLKVEERKVEVDKDLQSMQQLSIKKGSDDVFIKLGSDKDLSKRRDVTEKDERTKKAMSINEFLKPADGEKYYTPSGRGRGRGRGDRGSFRGGYVGATPESPTAPSIADQGQFPTLGAKK